MIFNLIFSALCFAKILAVASTPDLGWLMQQVGGEEIEVSVLAKPGENFHFIEARPDFALKLARAQLFCQVGADLEIGWVPKILEKAANPKLLPGGSGNCDLSKKVQILEKPQGAVDRSMGDAHAAGNPHYWLSPIEMKSITEILVQRLSEISPEKKSVFESNGKKTVESLEKTFQEVKSLLKPLEGKKFVQYHKDFTYFMNAYGLKTIGSIEEISGVSPSASRIAQVALEAKSTSVHLALAAPSNPTAVLQKFSELSGVRAVVLPTSLQGMQPNAFDLWQKLMGQKLISP